MIVLCWQQQLVVVRISEVWETLLLDFSGNGVVEMVLAVELQQQMRLLKQRYTRALAAEKSSQIKSFA